MRRFIFGGLVLTSVVCCASGADVSKAAKGKDAAVKSYPPEMLAIGKDAPDIVGEDIAGKRFKLSDYRGKVVVLDFWGNW
jgi:hypothetical protein